MAPKMSEKRRRFPATMNVRPFVALRIPEVSTSGTWQAVTAIEPSFGGFRFPDTAIPLRCMKDDGKVEIQPTYAADSTRTLIFEFTAQIVILPNALIYYDDHLKEDFKGNLDDLMRRGEAKTLASS